MVVFCLSCYTAVFAVLVLCTTLCVPSLLFCVLVRSSPLKSSGGLPPLHTHSRWHDSLSPLMPSQVRSVRLLLTSRRCQHPPQRFSPVLVPYPSTLFIPSCVCVLAFSSLRVIALMRRRFQSPHPLPFRLRHCTRQSLAVSFLFPRHLPYRHRTTPRSILHTHPSVFMYTQCCYCPSHH
jgi:hypothetical protein